MDGRWRKNPADYETMNFREKDRIYLSVIYGGQGDGTTDNKPAFDRAIVKACQKRAGDNIQVEPGTYLINGPIHLKRQYEPAS